MNANFEACPYCGKKIMKGAMRCMACGKILKTAEEQQASIERYKQAKQTDWFSKFVKFIFFIFILITAAVVFTRYGDSLTEFIKQFLHK